MRERLLRKLKQNKAFTLMEMMITVAVIVVLLGISVIAITDWTKKLKMTELDSYAKTVYLEAQNQLASLETEGSLVKLYNDLAINEGQYYDEYNGRKLVEAPADYDVAVYGDYYERMYYFSSDDDIMTTFVPDVSLSDDYGCYLIELNPESGDVYGVFYWETDNVDIPMSAEETYAYIKDMTVAEGDANNRELASRTEYQIGYYGGAVGDSISTSSYQLNQQVRIVNGEELYVEISYDYKDRVIEHINGDTKPFNVEITIVGETSGVEWIPEFDIKNNYVIKDGRIITGLLLDGMGEKQSFAEIVSDAGKNFIPGENLKVSVKTIYQYDSVKLKEQSSAYETNSLFHDVVDKTVDNGSGEILERTIGVSCVRHLRNLNATNYNGNIVTTSNGKVIDSYKVLQKNDIDASKGVYIFDKRDFVVPENEPIIIFSPIANSAIFETGSKIVTVDGNDFAIKNLVVTAGANDAGLFARANNVTFKNVKLEDYTLKADGFNNVGALVGYAIRGTIDHSGVYLPTSYRDENGIKQYYNQESDSTYGNKMAAHYQTMMITGGTNVGGLVGNANGTYITDSYSAVQVKGNSTVGGLVGCISGIISENASTAQIDTDTEIGAVVSLKNSYASGDVYAAVKEAGGLIGYSKHLCAYNAYATGDVYSNDEMAGFIGESFHGYYKKCTSYGEVLKNDGTEVFKDLSVGGFFALGTDNNADVASIGYLSQIGYNANDGDLQDSELCKKEYKELSAAAGKTSAAKSFPYDGNLLFKAFPFEMVTEHHYGDWASQYFINTSLVYYEKYSDGSYGYYSVTKLTDVTEEESETSKYVWVLDSLRDETCKEDGYALLTMFYLDSVDYSVYQYADKTNDNVKNPKWQYAQMSETDTTPITGTLKVSSNQNDPNAYGSDKMVRLVQQGALVFNAYEEVDNPYSADYTGKPIKSSFTTNGMYLYQLPYELQNTYRYNVDNFYDVIVFDEGYAVGNLKSEDEDEVGGTPVISDEVYYYCPHFSKLAINPGLGVSESTTNFVTLEAPDVVHVRSARQLNNLGRVPYYWNEKGGGAFISYEQESDINFSTYAEYRGEKKYCGKPYDLLAFDLEYSNQPIGEWNGDSGGYGAFQNNYDGNYHKIIDYCVKSDKQYVGLFGEIYNAEIKNIVMTVSDPKQTSTNAGLIIGTFKEDSTSQYTGENRRRTGVGALVGSDYTIGKADGDATLFTVTNCASAGYKVQYHLTDTTATEIQPLGIAVGGLIGYGRGNVSYSSANNDVKLIADADYIGTYNGKLNNYIGCDAAVFLGGFTGSYYFGTTLYCYSGGTIAVDNNNEQNCVMRLRIGGFCPGWLDAPGINQTGSTEEVRYQNIYSYTDVLVDIGTIRESWEDDCDHFKHLIPVVGRMVVQREEKTAYKYVFPSLRSETYYKWGTETTTGSATGVRVPGMSYYLQPVYADQINKMGSEHKEYFVDAGSDRPQTCTYISYLNLSDMDWIMNNTPHSDVELVVQEAKETVPYDSALIGQEYPFPAFVHYENEAGEKVYIHYGDWPTP